MIYYITILRDNFEFNFAKFSIHYRSFTRANVCGAAKWKWSNKKKFVQICDRRGSGNKKNDKNEIKRTAVDEKQQ